MADEESVPPRTQSRKDVDNIDPVADVLERLQTYLRWIDEHRASFEHYRKEDPEAAERELYYLRDATDQAIMYLNQLADLLFRGLSIDSTKQLPSGLLRNIAKRKK